MKTIKESCRRIGMAGLLALPLFVVTFAPAAGANRTRYTGALANGQRIEGNKLRDWHDEKAMPLLDGHPLLAPANPLRWLRDQSQSLAELPMAYIEFTNGDRLPGVVIDYRTGEEEPFDPQPPHLVVQVALNFEPPENRSVTEIRVATQFIRRIVWQRRDRTPRPGTATYRDGRLLEFRALRFRAGEFHVLSVDGEQRIDWGDLAELNLPMTHAWTAWFDQLAAVCPTPATRLISIESSSGLIATTSLARLAARFEGNSSDADRWAHGLQPAWSLDILWIPFRNIIYYRTFAVHEIPLSRIPPKAVSYQAGIGGRREFEVDRNVLGMPLRNQALEFGWGIGVYGGTSIEFDLPPGATSLRASVCLDGAAGSGGCVRPRILANDANGVALWEGALIVGSESVIDTGPIKLKAEAGSAETVVLQMDAVLAGRPSGADPLDIRDYANWCEPTLTVDPNVVQAELSKRLPARFAAWRDWTVEIAGQTEQAESVQILFQRNEAIPGTFETAVSLLDQPLVVRREFKPKPADRWLVIAARRLTHGGETPTIEVRIGGSVSTFKLPTFHADAEDVTPLAVPLPNGQEGVGDAVTVEIRQLGSAGGAGVHYGAITTSPQLPTICRLALAKQSSPPFRLMPARRVRVELPSTLKIRSAPKWGEARLVRFAFHKQGGGQVTIELEDDQPREQPAVYSLGQGDGAARNSNRIWTERLPNEWIVITRDLFADFGNIDLAAITFEAQGGEDALIGSFDLARTRADLDLLPVVGRAEGRP